MKLVVQIPCLNEEATLPAALASIPRSIPGVDVVEVLVVDDGSSDRTAEVARAHGADHIVRFRRRKGLAYGFMAGLDAALRVGADVIVNTDADNQYPGAAIPSLIAPILSGEADMVVGDRGVSHVGHFSWTKRRLQTLGSWVVRKVSGTQVPDTTSGFRALTREAALRINIVSEFTYTLESIIQAGKKKLAIASVPIEARETRPSRLFGSTWEYVKRSAATILRIYAMYEPFKVFVLLGSALLAGGLGLGLRYAWFWWQGEIRGHIQSAILAVLLLILGFQTLQWGVMADLIASNRKLIEDLLYRVRQMELGGAERSGREPGTAPVIDPGRVSIVIPAFDEELGLGPVVERVVALRPWCEVLVVDDGSRDRTAEVASAAGARVVRHPYNKGNGAAVKTGIREARGEFVLLMDADGQHDPDDVLRVLEPLDRHDLVIGARTSKDQTATRALGNWVFTRLASWLTGRPIPDLTSGFRAARRERLVEILHLLPNGFSYPTTSCLALLKAGHNVTFVPIRAHRRVGQSKIRVLQDGTKFLLIILKIVTLYSPLRVFFPIAGTSFLLGLAYGLWNVATHGKIPMGSALLIQLAVVVFLFGLISEQIAAGQDRR